MDGESDSEDVEIVEQPSSPVLNISDRVDTVLNTDKQLVGVATSALTPLSSSTSSSAHNVFQSRKGQLMSSNNSHRSASCRVVMRKVVSYLLLDSDSDFSDVEICDGPPQEDSNKGAKISKSPSDTTGRLGSDVIKASVSERSGNNVNGAQEDPVELSDLETDNDEDVQCISDPEAIRSNNLDASSREHFADEAEVKNAQKQAVCATGHASDLSGITGPLGVQKLAFTKTSDKEKNGHSSQGCETVPSYKISQPRGGQKRGSAVETGTALDQPTTKCPKIVKLKADTVGDSRELSAGVPVASESQNAITLGDSGAGQGEDMPLGSSGKVMPHTLDLQSKSSSSAPKHSGEETEQPTEPVQLVTSPEKGVDSFVNLNPASEANNQDPSLQPNLRCLHMGTTVPTDSVRPVLLVKSSQEGVIYSTAVNQNKGTENEEFALDPCSLKPHTVAALPELGDGPTESDCWVKTEADTDNRQGSGLECDDSAPESSEADHASDSAWHPDDEDEPQEDSQQPEFRWSNSGSDAVAVQKRKSSSITTEYNGTDELVDSHSRPSTSKESAGPGNSCEGDSCHAVNSEEIEAIVRSNPQNVDCVFHMLNEDFTDRNMSETFAVDVKTLHDQEFVSCLQEPVPSEKLINFLLKSQDAKFKVCRQCSLEGLQYPCLVWGNKEVITSNDNGVLMVTLAELARIGVIDYHIADHKLLDQSKFPAVWSSNNRGRKKSVRGVSLVFVVFVVEDALVHLDLSKRTRLRMEKGILTPFTLIASANLDCHTTESRKKHFLTGYRCSFIMSMSCKMGEMRSDSQTAILNNASLNRNCEESLFVHAMDQLLYSKQEMFLKTGFLSSLLFMYPPCPCQELSKLDLMERKTWKKVEYGSLPVPSLQVLRFMGHNVFCFNEKNPTSQYLYVSVAELRDRKLLPAHLMAVQQFFTDSNPLLKTAKIRKLHPIERRFLSQFFTLPDRYADEEQESVLNFACTPFALKHLYQRLGKINGKYMEHSHALFYMMTLGHQCWWSLQVTPPTCQLHRIPGYEQADVKKQPAARIQKKEAFYDGGGGTAPAVRKLTESLNIALQKTINAFQLQYIAQPFCQCRVLATCLHKYRFLTFDGVELSHVTYMMFAGKVLHCWKRNYGFFVSYAELEDVGLLPSTLLHLAVSRFKDQPWCSFMLPCERKFLSHMCLGEHKNSGVLLNIKFLHLWYGLFDDSQGPWHCIAEEVFYIKLPKHTCLGEREHLSEANLGLGMPPEDAVGSDEETPAAWYSQGEEVTVDSPESAWETVEMRAEQALSELPFSEGIITHSGKGGQTTGADESLDIFPVALIANHQIAAQWENEGHTPVTGVATDQQTGETHAVLWSESSSHSSTAPTSFPGFVRTTMIREDWAHSHLPAVISDQEVRHQTHAADDISEIAPHEHAVKEETEDGLNVADTSGSVQYQEQSETQSSAFSGQEMQPAAVKEETEDGLNVADTAGSVQYQEQSETQSSAFSGQEMQPAAVKEETEDSLNVADTSGSVQYQEQSETQSSAFSGQEMQPAAVKEEDAQSEQDGEHATQSSQVSNSCDDEIAMGEAVTEDVGKEPEANRSMNKDPEDEHVLGDDSESDPPSQPSIQRSVSQTAVSLQPTAHPAPTETANQHQKDRKYMELLPACPCSERQPGPFPRFSFLQCMCSANSQFTILSDVGQAIMKNKMVFYFNISSVLYFSVLHLRHSGALDFSPEPSSVCSSTWKKGTQIMSLDEKTFLLENGQIAESSDTNGDLLVSSGLLRQVMESRGMSLNALYMHQVGHICPSPHSVAHRVQKSNPRMLHVQVAWSRAFHWYQDFLKEQKTSVQHSSSTGQDKGLSSTNDHCAKGGTGRPGEQRSRVVCVRRLQETGEAADDQQSSEFVSVSPVPLQEFGLGSIKQEPCWEPQSPFAADPRQDSGIQYTQPNKHQGKTQQGPTLQQKRSDGVRCEQGQTEMGSSSQVSEHLQPMHICVNLKMAHSSVVPEVDLDERKGGIRPVHQDRFTQVRTSSALEGIVLHSSCKEIQVFHTEGEVLELLVDPLFSQYQVVLTGTLTAAGCRYVCFSMGDILYVNWREVVNQLDEPSDGKALFLLARQLHAFLYQPPLYVNQHFSRRYGVDLDLLTSTPWVAMNTLVAIYNLGSGILSRERMLKRFVDAKPSAVQLGVFLLVSKDASRRV